MGLDEMTGSPNLTIVPDPATFRVLPWRRASAGYSATNTSAMACRSTSPAPAAAQATARELRGEGQAQGVGLELEWYLARVIADRLGDERIGVLGLRGRPIRPARSSRAIRIIPNATWT